MRQQTSGEPARAFLFRPTSTAKDPTTGKPVKEKQGVGMASYADGDGITRQVKLSSNKTAAQQILNVLVRKAELARAGLGDPFEEHRKTTLAKHLVDWEEVLLARKNTAEYVKLKVTRARRVINAAGFVFISDLSASRIESALADLRADPENSRFGIQTSNHHLAAVKQFARWLVKDRRTGENPLAHLAGGNVRLDRRHDRRELTANELTRLLTATRASNKTFKGLTGEDRYFLYATAAGSGFRASELASLTPVSFNLEGESPVVTLLAEDTKNRTAAANQSRTTWRKFSESISSASRRVNRYGPVPGQVRKRLPR